MDLLAHLMNDHGNAERLRVFAGSGIRYCHDFKKWLIWDGARWTIDGQDQILKLAKAAMLEFFRQASDSKNEPAEKFARQSLDARRLGAMVHLAECELPVSPEELDTDTALLNFGNGTGGSQNRNAEDSLTWPTSSQRLWRSITSRMPNAWRF